MEQTSVFPSQQIEAQDQAKCESNDSDFCPETYVAFTT